jgi:hypothetical protein
VFGYSSGASLALKAAPSGLPITHLVLYEPPYRTDDSHPGLPAGFTGQLAELVAAGRRGDAVELYQTGAVGIPEEVVAQLRHAPFRPGLEAIAHTLAYDAAIIGDRSLQAGCSLPSPSGLGDHGGQPGSSPPGNRVMLGVSASRWSQPGPWIVNGSRFTEAGGQRPRSGEVDGLAADLGTRNRRSTERSFGAPLTT